MISSDMANSSSWIDGATVADAAAFPVIASQDGPVDPELLA